MPGYAKTKRDFEFLNALDVKYANSDLYTADQIGAADEVFNLMADPTKARAKAMYETAIEAWFLAYRQGLSNRIPAEFDKRIQTIKSHYNIC